MGQHVGGWSAEDVPEMHVGEREPPPLVSHPDESRGTISHVTEASFALQQGFLPLLGCLAFSRDIPEHKGSPVLKRDGHTTDDVPRLKARFRFQLDASPSRHSVAQHGFFVAALPARDHVPIGLTKDLLAGQPCEPQSMVVDGREAPVEVHSEESFPSLVAEGRDHFEIA
jgi:hypothetical protein